MTKTLVVTKKVCATCVFCDQVVSQKAELYPVGSYLVDHKTQIRLPGRICRRHAPIYVSVEGVTRLGWPWVEAEDWCGDWKAETHTFSYRTTVDELGNVKTETIKE